MERLKDDSQLRAVVMPEHHVDRRLASSVAGSSWLPDDAAGQFEAGEEDQSSSAAVE